MIDPLIIAYIAIIALLLVCSAFFSMSETAFTSASQVRLKKMSKDGDKRAEKALYILGNYDKFLTTILIGNNLVNIAATSIATIAFAMLLGEATGSLASTVVMTLVVLTFGEITPKTLAKRRPERIVLRIVGIVNAIEIIFSPLSWLFGKLTGYIGRKTGGEDSSTMTEDELEVMIDEIEGDGVIEKTEGELIKSAIRFDDTSVSEVYVPRMDIVGIDAGSAPEDLGRLISTTGFSRIPVYDGSIDNIIGVVYAKEFFTRRFNGESPTIRDLMKPVKYVPETMSIATIFSDFQKTKIHMAVVLDSYGGTMGIVTLEDILEELVGDIWDESDDIQQDMVQLPDGTWSVKGTANIFDIMERLGVEFDPGEYEDYSVTGYVFYRLNRAPVRGDTVETGRVRITVKAVKGRRAVECLFAVSEPPQEEVAEE